MVYPLTNWADDEALRRDYEAAGEAVGVAGEPRPIRCAACGHRLGDRLGELVVVRVRVRAGQTKRMVGREVEITCPCGETWRSAST